MYKNLLFIMLLFAISSIGHSQDIESFFKEEKVDGPTTSIEFEVTEFHFGTITAGELVQNVFYFTNTGTEPLVITNAKGTCGCTVPQFPNEPIMPGERASLTVRFNSKNKKGFQSKRVTITANTEPIKTYITIRGKVEKNLEPEKLKVEQDIDVDESTVNIYPNPTTDKVEVSLSEYQGLATTIQIFDNEGRLMETKNIGSLGEETTVFEVADYVAGSYTVSIAIEGKHRIAKQFVKQ